MSNLLIHDNENIIIYEDDLIKDINEDFFEANKWIHNENSVVSVSGRGETIFFEHQGLKCVLKHYHRGGILGPYLKDRYLWTGMQRSRSIREFIELDVLSNHLGLPVPRPFAARVKRSGITYVADLITIEVEDSKPLSELIREGNDGKDVWEAIGKCLCLFDEKGIYHPDLNASNILIDNELEVYLIDFDSAGRIHDYIGSPKKTLERFHRSLEKTYKKNNKEFLESDWKIIISNFSANQRKDYFEDFPS